MVQGPCLWNAIRPYYMDTQLVDGSPGTGEADIYTSRAFLIDPIAHRLRRKSLALSYKPKYPVSTRLSELREVFVFC